MMKFFPFAYVSIVLYAITGCQPSDNLDQAVTPAEEAGSFAAEGPHEVFAWIETAPVEAVQGDDAADDPAIWYHRKKRGASLILGTNKKLGLDVYNLAGERVAFHRAGRVNNVDLRYDFPWHDSLVDIAAATNRSYNRIDIWIINQNNGALTRVSDTTMGARMGEVYGFCLYKNRQNSQFYALASNKDGLVVQWLLEPQGEYIALKEVRRLQLRRQVEGMVADDEKNILYIAEEEGGIFKFSALPEAGDEATLVKYSDTANPHLAYDIEGLALFTLPDGEGYLLASSQGNNRYLVYDRAGDNAYRGCFVVTDSIVDGAEETDGIAVTHLPMSPDFPAGLFVCQDGFNRQDSGAAPQNFKLVSWEAIAQAFENQLGTNHSYRSF